MSEHEDRIAELKSALKVKMSDLSEGMHAGIEVKGADVIVSEESRKKFENLWADANQIKQYINMAEASYKGLDLGSADTDVVIESKALEQAVDKLMQQGTKSLGERFTESKEFKERTSEGKTHAFEVDGFDIATWGQKDVYTGMNATSMTRQFGRIQFDPMVPRGQRRARIRDLFPVAATAANMIEYFQVVGFVENTNGQGSNPNVSGGGGNARSVKDWVAGAPGNFGLKPKSNLSFRNAEALVKTIAHWEAAHRNVLDDEPLMQSTINNELLYGLALEEDRQILKGSGVNDELLGLLNTQYLQEYAAPNGELRADSLRRAATLSILAYYPSTGYVLHPNDWEQIELQKAAGDGQYMIVSNIAIGAEQRVWRQPVVETPVIDEGTFACGAWGTGAQLYDRQQANVRIADQHADLFARNAVAVLAEERLAFAVKRPESFVKGRFQGVAAFPADEDANPAT